MTLSQRLAKLAFSAIYVKNRTENDLRYWLYRGLHKGEEPVITVNGYKLKLDLEDEGISKDLLNVRGREFFSSSYLQGVLEKDDLVYDIGANIGYYAILDALRCRRVIAIEPVPKNTKRLIVNIQLNHLKNVDVLCWAVGGEEGEKTMYLNTASNWSSLIRHPHGQTTGTICVPTTTIDHLVKVVKGSPDLIRMDIEGYEYYVIRGARKTLEDPRLKLFIEVHPTMPREQRIGMLAILKEAGFGIKKLFLEPESWNFKNMGLLNWLGKRFGFPGYGEHEPTYAELERLLDAGCCPEVFFEKDSGKGQL